jgi:hypothetical protein
MVPAFMAALCIVSAKTSHDPAPVSWQLARGKSSSL